MNFSHVVCDGNKRSGDRGQRTYSIYVIFYIFPQDEPSKINHFDNVKILPESGMMFLEDANKDFGIRSGCGFDLMIDKCQIT